MSPESPEPPARELDDYVEAYEVAQAGPGPVHLADFLPAPDHPLRRRVLCELARIDLEYSWRRGQRKRLEYYQELFPELAADRASLQAVAFEEYRLRRQGGEQPSPDEYERRYGIATASWPGAENPPAEPDSLFGGAEAADPSQRQQRAAPTELLGPAPAPGLEEAALAYREFRLANRPQDSSALDSWHDSFGGRSEHADLFRDVHRSDPEAAYQLAQAATSMPEAGSDFLGFHLLEELGRGAFGRVYLAQQGDLANRPVALKISTNLLGESQTLAQLQHTNIVPIYSVHRAGPFQAVCMPYFGSTTLADVLKDLEKRELLPDSGREFVSTLNARKSVTRPRPNSKAGATTGAVQAGQPPSAPEQVGPPTAPRADATETLKKLEGFSYVQAVLWMGLRLADGLAHAHERGILHRDLKPANVLLTDEGQPMLLDFNLSEDTKLRANASAALVGGTLPYMAPEHLEAFQGGKRPVDARSELYALGVILYELLTSRHPFTVHRGSLPSVLPDMIEERRSTRPEVRRWNRDVSPAVEAIVRHCLEPEPDRRYQSAAELQEDLQCHLDHLPLRHATEPSVWERAQKWARRHRRLAWAGLIVWAMAVILATSTTLVLRDRHIARLRAEDALGQSREEMKAVHALLVSRPGESERIPQGVELGRRVLERYHLLDDDHWQKRPEISALPPEEQGQLHDQLGELALLLAGVRSTAEPRTGRQKPDADAPPGLTAEEVQRLRRAAELVPLGRARRLCLEAREHLTHARYREALPLLQEAARLDGQDEWVWFLLGNCADGLGQDADAATYYSVCLARWPRAYPAYFNRGLVWHRLNNPRRAKEDFDQVVLLQPDHGDAYFNRGIASWRLGQDAEALADFTRAAELDPNDPRIYFMRARVRARLGDAEGARRDREEGMRREPVDDVGWSARGYEKLAGDPEGALRDFDKALQLNPRSFGALKNKAHALSERLNRPEDSIPVYNTLVEMYPDHVPARSGRGVVLARLGRREEALADAREALTRDAGRHVAYQVAGIYALTSRQIPDDRRTAFRLLAQALQQGYGFDLLDRDTDLDPVRRDPEFRRLAEAAHALRSVASAPAAP